MPRQTQICLDNPNRRRSIRFSFYDRGLPRHNSRFYTLEHPAVKNLFSNAGGLKNQINSGVPSPTKKNKSHIMRNQQ